MTDISEILKDSPKRTKLYSPFCGECYLYCIENDIIRVSDTSGNTYSFYKDGKQRLNGECLLFPSKENRDWNTFTKTKFEKGDFIYNNGFVCIFAGTKNIKYGKYESDSILFFACISSSWFIKQDKECVFINQIPDVGIGGIYKDARLATEIEKIMLLEAIKIKGYEWDSEKLELRKKEQKFKIFDRVLVRNTDQSLWRLAEYAFRNKGHKEGDFHHFTVGGLPWKYCIPYKGNERLLGTIEDCK